jgi:hypothetical protein
LSIIVRNVPTAEHFKDPCPVALTHLLQLGLKGLLLGLTETNQNQSKQMRAKRDLRAAVALLREMRHGVVAPLSLTETNQN